MCGEHCAEVLAIQLAVIDDQEPDLRHGGSASDRRETRQRTQRGQLCPLGMSIGPSIRIVILHNPVTRGQTVKA